MYIAELAIGRDLLLFVCPASPRRSVKNVKAWLRLLAVSARLHILTLHFHPQHNAQRAISSGVNQQTSLTMTRDEQRAWLSSKLPVLGMPCCARFQQLLIIYRLLIRCRVKVFVQYTTGPMHDGKGLR